MNTLQAEVWPQTSIDGEARASALSAHAQTTEPVVPVASVTYRSSGRALLIGDMGALAAALPELSGLQCVAVCTAAGDETPADIEDGAVAWVSGSVTGVTGHLGMYTATVTTAAGEERNPAAALGAQNTTFDLVLDLQPQPSLDREKLPPGYFATRGDAAAVREALAQLPELVGEFEKPRYFAYDAEICAHGRRGLSGCHACIDACATDAIRSLGESIEVDPYLCQGCGSCVTVCPTGAMTYAYQPLDELLATVRRTLHAYRQAGGSHPCVLLYGSDASAEQVAIMSERLPERVLPFALEEVGEVGIEAWLAMLAYGADHVVLLAGAETPRRERMATARQIEYLTPVLAGLGGHAERVRLLGPEDDPVACLTDLPPVPPQPLATFAAVGGKRAVFQLALEHLVRQAPEPPEPVALPAGAPFGAIEVKRDACTLCMACVSVCPSMAAVGGGDQPRLLFHEDRCVQCGMCETACPEDAITLAPRMNYAAHVTPAQTVLNEEELFHCVSCGKAFATVKLIDRMTQKLAGHWMFQDERSRSRIRMCEDCRVKDLFADEAGMQVHKQG